MDIYKCDDCNKHHYDNLIYCVYCDGCFLEKHNECNECSDCLVFKKSNNNAKKCIVCNTKNMPNQSTDINTNDNKDNNKDNKNILYDHSLCELFKECDCENNIYCPKCKQCHHFIQTEYCSNCNYCFDYKHKNCKKCNACLSTSGKKNKDDNICLSCEEIKYIYVSNQNFNFYNDYEIDEGAYIYYCKYENKYFSYQHEYCKKCNKCKSEDDKHCSKCNKCHRYSKTKYCSNCQCCFDYGYNNCECQI